MHFLYCYPAHLQPSQDIPANAGFLCYRVSTLSVAMKARGCYSSSIAMYTAVAIFRLKEERGRLIPSLPTRKHHAPQPHQYSHHETYKSVGGD
jgi:hypothetical protein